MSVLDKIRRGDYLNTIVHKYIHSIKRKVQDKFIHSDFVGTPKEINDELERRIQVEIENQRIFNKAYDDETLRLRQLFKHELFEEFGVTNNPKVEKLWSIATDDVNEFDIIYDKFEELVDLIK